MNKNDAVEAWLATYDNPQKANVCRVREIILGADDRITESVKWKAPTFEYQGNMASFFPRAKKRVTLMFHQGALIPGDHPLLTGDGETARSVKLDDAAAIDASADALRAIVRSWCDMKDAR